MRDDHSGRQTAGPGHDEGSAAAPARPVWRRPWVSGLLTGLAIAGTAAVSLGVMSIAIRQILLEDLRTYLRRTAESTAALIDDDAHAQLVDSAQTNSFAYRAAAQPLRILVRTNPDIRFAYSGIVRRDTMYYILDGDTSPEQAWVMERDQPTEGEREASRTGQVVVERHPSPTEWGTGIRAYVPLADTGTGPFPYVGITIDAERFDTWMHRVSEAAIKSWLAALAIAILVGARTVRAERRRERAEQDMARMREAALVSAEERHALEQRLLGRQKMEALGTLAGGVAHDFNNLLTIVLGHAELLAEESVPGTDVADSAHAIRTAASRARDVVRRILLFARPEAEHRQLLDLVPIIGETVQLLRSTLPTSMTIRWRPPPSPVLAVADPAQMTQVLMNLGMNARQALRDGRGAVEFDLQSVTLDPDEAARLDTAPGQYARIRVRDDGVGMSEEVRRRVFEPFFTTRTMEQGTGLGLSVVEGVVRGHDGAVEVTSAPDEGSTFTLYLPVSATRELGGATAGTTIGIHGMQPPARLLLLDDDAGVLRAMSRVLSRAGYTVDAYDDAERAVAAVESSCDEYSVVVTDRTMPGLSGLDVARRVHAHAPRLPVVLLSGAVDDGDRDSAQFASIVVKPPDSADLIAAIEQALAEFRRSR